MRRGSLLSEMFIEETETAPSSGTARSSAFGSLDAAQRRANAGLWAGAGHVSSYANRTLRPVEVMVLIRHRERLSRRVLELGCGAGRVTGYLDAMAGEVHGLDVSAAMVAYCRRAYPRATFSTGDLRDLSDFADGSFDAIFASYNVVDVLAHEERQALLVTIPRMLSDGGLLIMSSHNRASASQIPKPTSLRARNPLRLAADVARMPRRVRNATRLSRFEHEEPEYAVLNDAYHHFSALHYYISRDAQARQLEEHGFELLECLDLDGRPVDEGEDAAHSPELHYVARAGRR